MKKKMTCMLAVLLAAVLCLSLASCGSKGLYDDLTVLETDLFETEDYAVAFRRGSDLAGMLDAMFAEDFASGRAKETASVYGLENSLAPVFEKGTSAVTDTADSAYVKEKGTLIVGVTLFDGMDYQDTEGNWIGFDADMANRFAERLGVRAEFREINWDNKLVELASKSIDCIWNGMTVTGEVTASCEISGTYMKNGQVLVVKKGGISAVSELVGKQVAVEGGSAGYAQATAQLTGVTVKEVTAQVDALLEVAAGTSDACVVDYVLARSLLKLG